jgi:hypothetical protein
VVQLVEELVVAPFEKLGDVFLLLLGHLDHDLTSGCSRMEPNESLYAPAEGGASPRGVGGSG